MNTVTITETKNQLSALLDRVRAGESLVILDRGRPVARLVPAIASPADASGRLERLERQGLISRGRERACEAILRDPPPSPRKGASALDALLAERREGR